MAAFIQGGSGCTQSTDLQEAIVVLEYLAGEGNKVALQRLTDVKEFSAQILPAEETLQHKRAESQARDQDGINSAPALGSHFANPEAVIQSNEWDGLAPHVSDDRNSEPTMIHSDVAGEFGNVDMVGDMELNIDWEASGIFSSFHDPGLPVTGVDSADWEEMERMFATREF